MCSALGKGFTGGGHRSLLSSYPSWLIIFQFCFLLVFLSQLVGLDKVWTCCPVGTSCPGWKHWWALALFGRVGYPDTYHPRGSWGISTSFIQEMPAHSCHWIYETSGPSVADVSVLVCRLSSCEYKSHWSIAGPHATLMESDSDSLVRKMPLSSPRIIF